MKRYYYHTPDGELHGPSDFDFLVREVRYAGLPLGLMVREERIDIQDCELKVVETFVNDHARIRH